MGAQSHWWAIALVVLIVLVLLAVTMWYLERRRTVHGGDVDDDETAEFDAGYIEGDGVLGGGPFRLSVRDPWYTEMLNGKKHIEARLDKKPYNRLKAGAPITIVRSRPHGSTEEYPGGKYKYNTKVKRVDKYSNIEALLKGEGVSKVYPGKKSMAEGVDIFKEFAPDVTAPVIAIELASA